jgi:hypothetical protein
VQQRRQLDRLRASSHHNEGTNGIHKTLLTGGETMKPKESIREGAGTVIQYPETDNPTLPVGRDN